MRGEGSACHCLQIPLLFYLSALYRPTHTGILLLCLPSLSILFEGSHLINLYIITMMA